jgi:hypothetical protein
MTSMRVVTWHRPGLLLRAGPARRQRPPESYSRSVFRKWSRPQRAALRRNRSVFNRLYVASLATRCPFCHTVVAPGVRRLFHVRGRHCRAPIPQTRPGSWCDASAMAAGRPVAAGKVPVVTTVRPGPTQPGRCRCARSTRCHARRSSGQPRWRRAHLAGPSSIFPACCSGTARQICTSCCSGRQ